MPLAKTASSWMGPAGLYVAAGVVCLAPVLLGGVSAAAHVLLCLLALLGLALHLLDRAREGRQLVVSWTVSVFALALLATLLVLLPLPEELRALLDVRSTDLKHFVTEGLSEPNRPLVLPVLAVDPPEAALALLRLIAALAVFIIVADRARRRASRVTFWRILVGGGGLLLLVSAFHRLANLDHVYGLVKLHANPPLRGPLVNPNHLARMFGGFSFLAVAYLPLVRDRRERTLVVGTAAVLGLSVIATLSLGGILAYGATTLCGLAVWWLARQSGEDGASRRRGTLALPLLLGLAAIGGVVWLTQDLLTKELIALGRQAPEASKTALYAPALRVLASHPWVGVGPGGIQTAMPSLLDVGQLTSARYTHVENFVLETLTAHGVLLGAGVLALGGVSAWHLLRRLPTPTLRAPLLALAFLTVGDLFDFVLQIPAGLLLAAACLGLAASAALERNAPAWRLSSRTAAVGFLALLVLTLTAAAVAVPQNRRLLDRDLSSKTAKIDAQLLEEAMARHPLDPWYAYMLSRQARLDRDAGAAMKWANRAIVLDPNNGPAHVEAARVLWANGLVDQALAEYRQAWASTHHNRTSLVEELARRTTDIKLRVAAVPEDHRAGRFSTCKHVDQERRRDAAAECWRGVLIAFPDDNTIRLKAADSTLRAGQHDKVLGLLGPLVDEDPLDGGVAKLLVASLASERDLSQALDKAIELRARVRTGRYELEWWILNAAKRLGRFADAQRALELARRGASRKQRAELDVAEARLLERMGNEGEALMRWKKIADNSPSDHQAHFELLRLQLELRMQLQAAVTLRTLRRLAKRAPDAAKLQRRLDALEVELEVQNRIPSKRRRPPLPPEGVPPKR